MVPSTTGACKNIVVRTIEPYAIELKQIVFEGYFNLSNHHFPTRNLSTFSLNSLCFISSLSVLGRDMAIQQDTQHLNSQLRASTIPP